MLLLCNTSRTTPTQRNSTILGAMMPPLPYRIPHPRHFLTHNNKNCPRGRLSAQGLEGDLHRQKRGGGRAEKEVGYFDGKRRNVDVVVARLPKNSSIGTKKPLVSLCPHLSARMEGAWMNGLRVGCSIGAGSKMARERISIWKNISRLDKSKPARRWHDFTWIY